jgi:hypothetical protein
VALRALVGPQVVAVMQKLECQFFSVLCGRRPVVMQACEQPARSWLQPLKKACQTETTLEHWMVGRRRTGTVVACRCPQ